MPATASMKPAWVQFTEDAGRTLSQRGLRQEYEACLAQLARLRRLAQELERRLREKEAELPGGAQAQFPTLPAEADKEKPTEPAAKTDVSLCDLITGYVRQAEGRRPPHGDSKSPPARRHGLLLLGAAIGLVVMLALLFWFGF